MADPQTKRAKLEIQLLSPLERHAIFNSIPGNEGLLSPEDELFQKDSFQLVSEGSTHFEYRRVLQMKEIRMAEEMIAIKVGTKIIEPFLLKAICNKLDPKLLFGLAYERLTYEQKIDVIRIIKHKLIKEKTKCYQLLYVLKLETIKTLLPKNEDGSLCAPSQMTRQIQLSAEKADENLVFPYPFGIDVHFPILFCNPIFVDFMDIVFERNAENPKVIEYKNLFMTDEDIVSKLESCLANLIMTILDGKEKSDEGEFVKDVSKAFDQLFRNVNVMKDATGSDKKEMYAIVGTEKSPFVIIETKSNAFSMNAVLQGIQYYGIMDLDDYIENDPCFLVLVDKGILILYGMAKVNRRVVCSCLLNLEFTSYHFDANNFSRTLYKCISGLYFLHGKLQDRLVRKADDQMHKKYFEIKSKISTDNQPYPAIFSVGGVEIKFKNCIRKSDAKECAYFKPCVYLVETADGRDAVLKIAHNYDVKSHEELQAAQPSLAPKIIAKEVLNGRYHIVLMEYLGESHDTLFNTMVTYGKDIDQEKLKNSLEDILGKLKALDIVHGDYRSFNILVKRPQVQAHVQNTSQQQEQQKDIPKFVLEDFKLIDFEFSGKVGTPYPFLAMKNDAITWPPGYKSYWPRKFDHDKFMLDQMELKGYKI